MYYICTRKRHGRIIKIHGHTPTLEEAKEKVPLRDGERYVYEDGIHYRHKDLMTENEWHCLSEFELCIVEETC